MTNVRSSFSSGLLGTAARSAALPLLGAALLCAAWLQMRVHSGVGHRLTGATHLRGRAAEQELLLLLFLLAAFGIFAARHALGLGLAGSAGLRRCKEKFRPEWHDRYLAFPLLAAPMALIAVAWVHVIRKRSRPGA